MKNSLATDEHFFCPSTKGKTNSCAHGQCIMSLKKNVLFKSRNESEGRLNTGFLGKTDFLIKNGNAWSLEVKVSQNATVNYATSMEAD
jgi:hypothetical protein